MRSTVSNKCVSAEKTVRMSLLLVRCLSSLSSCPVARMQTGFLCTAGRNLMRSLSSLGLLSKGFVAAFLPQKSAWQSACIMTDPYEEDTYKSFYHNVDDDLEFDWILVALISVSTILKGILNRCVRQ